MKNIAGICTLVLSLTAFLDNCVAEETQQAIARPASAEAKVVLDFLNSIQGRKMVAGHHVMYGRLKDRDLKYIVDTTGRFPGLIEFEDGIFARKYHQDYTSVQKQLVRDAIAYWKNGGLVLYNI